jgi:predicted ATPase with chaperone activity
MNRPTAADAASPVRQPAASRPGEQSLRDVSDLVRRLSGEATAAAEPGSETAGPAFGDSNFLPPPPTSLKEAELTERELEALTLKFLLSSTRADGRRIAAQLGLPFMLVNQALAQMRTEQLLQPKEAGSFSDYIYELTPAGRERARNYAEQLTYYGTAPVALETYLKSVAAQSVKRQQPGIEKLCAAFSDLMLDIEMVSRLGQAIHAGSALFLYGAPGNGKTSLAQRMTKSFGESLWIPKAIHASGEIVRLFDQSNHEPIPLPKSAGYMDEAPYDQRWVLIKRPTIVVGGELAMDNLEITHNAITGISEAPLQLKANGGTLVIDDFGRQRMSTRELLNRWIIPLENGYDFLELASGRRLQVPFDQMIVFSTNLEPKELVDEAFLRRIPYKVEVGDPTVAQFKKLLLTTAKNLNLEMREPAADYLINTHYRLAHRPMRFCHPRDLLKHVSVYCSFTKQPRKVTEKALDAAVATYFPSL